VTRFYLAPRILSLIFAFLFLWTTLARAGTVTMSAQTNVITWNDKLQIVIKIKNKGDETAHEVQASVPYRQRVLLSPVIKHVRPGEPHTFRFEESVSGMKPGRYPLTVTVHFQDGNGYPFSALSGTMFSVGSPVSAGHRCVAHDVTMVEKGKLLVDVRNLKSESKKITASVSLPREFSTPKSQVNFELGPEAERTIAFKIVNVSAMTNSANSLFCYLEYEQENTHYTAFTSATARIAKPGSWFQKTRWFWIGMVVILGIVIAGGQFRMKP